MEQQEFNFFPSVSPSSARKLDCGQAEELLMSLASPPLSLPPSPLCVVLLLGETAGWALPQSMHTHSHKSPRGTHTSVYTRQEDKHNQTGAHTYNLLG